MNEINEFRLENMDQIINAKVGDIIPICNVVDSKNAHHVTKGLITRRKGESREVIAKNYHGIPVQINIKNIEEDGLEGIMNVIHENNNLTRHYRIFACPEEMVMRGQAKSNSTYKQLEWGDPRINQYKKATEKKNESKN